MNSRGTWGRPSTNASTPFGRAGWLLAELSLVLMVVALGAEAVVTTRSTSSSHVVIPPEPPRIVGIDRKNFADTHVVTRFAGDPVAAREAIRLIKSLGKGRRPGLILMFGVTRNRSDADNGTVVADQLRDSMKAYLEKNDILVRTFLRKWKPGLEEGRVNIDVYYFTTDLAKAPR